MYKLNKASGAIRSIYLCIINICRLDHRGLFYVCMRWGVVTASLLLGDIRDETLHYKRSEARDRYIMYK